MPLFLLFFFFPPLLNVKHIHALPISLLLRLLFFLFLKPCSPCLFRSSSCSFFFCCCSSYSSSSLSSLISSSCSSCSSSSLSLSFDRSLVLFSFPVVFLFPSSSSSSTDSILSSSSSYFCSSVISLYLFICSLATTGVQRFREIFKSRYIKCLKFLIHRYAHENLCM